MKTTVQDSSKGKDQFGVMIGKHQPGDTAFIHLKGWYVIAKDRKIQFLNTHRISDTALVELTITGSESKPSSWLECLEYVLCTMMLGDTVTTTLDSVPTNEEDLLQRQLGRVPHHASALILEIESVWIVSDGKVHRSPNRNKHDSCGICSGVIKQRCINVFHKIGRINLCSAPLLGLKHLFRVARCVVVSTRPHGTFKLRHRCPAVLHSGASWHNFLSVSTSII